MLDLSRGSFAWDPLLGSCRLACFACERSLGSCPVGALVHVQEVSLGYCRSGFVAWQLSLGIPRHLAWELSFAIIRFGEIAKELSVESFRMEAFAWDPPLGNWWLRVFAWGRSHKYFILISAVVMRFAGTVA